MCLIRHMIQTFLHPAEYLLRLFETIRPNYHDIQLKMFSKMKDTHAGMQRVFRMLKKSMYFEKALHRSPQFCIKISFNSFCMQFEISICELYRL